MPNQPNNNQYYQGQNYPNQNYNGQNQAGNYYPNQQPQNNYSPYPQNTAFDNQNLNYQAPQTQKPKRSFSLPPFLQKKWILIVAILIITLIIAVIAITVIRSGNNNQTDGLVKYDNVLTSINAPSTLSQGTPGQWEIEIENQMATSITNLRVDLTFDRDFEFLQSLNPATPENAEGTVYFISSLDPVGGRITKSRIQLEGVLNGNVDTVTSMSGILTYIPLDANGVEQPVVELPLSEVPAETKITSPELLLTLNTTSDEVANGGEVKLLLKIENKTDKEIRDLRLRMNYPGNEASFNYKSSQYFRSEFAGAISQPSSGDDTWNITRLPAGTTQTLEIVGNVFGGNENQLTFGAEIALEDSKGNFQQISQAFKDVTVLAQPIVVSTQILGRDSLNLFEPGEQLTIEVNYENQSQKTLQDVEIFSFIEDKASVLDLNTINFTGGERGDITGTELVWKAPRIPGLASLLPSQKGSFRYTVNVKDEDKFLNTSLSQQEYYLIPGVRAGAENLDEVVNSGIKYKARGQFIFTIPKPQKVGVNETTNRDIYRITLQLENTQNEVSNVQVKAKIPFADAWREDSIRPATDSSSLDYNSQTGELTWNAGSLESYTGISRLTREINFELEAGSSESILMEDIVASGLDVFTGERFEQKSAELRR